jgi:hypothetical protein
MFERRVKAFQLSRFGAIGVLENCIRTACKCLAITFAIFCKSESAARKRLSEMERWEAASFVCCRMDHVSPGLQIRHNGAGECLRCDRGGHTPRTLARKSEIIRRHAPCLPVLPASMS